MIKKKIEEFNEIKLDKKKISILILCGGYGSRISRLTNKIPKPLIKINNKPFLYYLIKNISRYNFVNFRLLTFYKNNKFKRFKKDYEKELNVNIQIIKEKEKLDTGGSILSAIRKFRINTDFIALNGDTYVDLNYDEYYKEYKKYSRLFIPIIKKDNKSSKLISLNLNKDDKIYFSKDGSYMNSGIYFFNKKNILKFTKIKKCSFETLIAKSLIKENKVKGKIYLGDFLDIGSYESIKKSSSFIDKIFNKKKLLFLDRDNTLNIDKGYTYKINDLQLIEKNISAIKKKYDDYIKVIISNQSGIGRGIFTLKKHNLFMNMLFKKLNKNNIFISRSYFCPFHKDAKIKKFKKQSKYRKPNTGMIQKALKELDIKKSSNCLMIGDSIVDKKLAKNCKIKFIDQKIF